MRAIEVREFGGPEVLVAVDRPEPVPTTGRIRVRVHAATVNPVDWATRAGWVPSQLNPHRPPFVLGWDLAGTVLDAAPGLPVGRRVVGMIPWWVTGDGAYAEVVAVDPGWLAPLPDELPDPTAATLPLNGLTARQGLDRLALTSGDTLLVTGASGGVGGFAVQLAAAAGLRVVAIGSVGDEDVVRSLGAAHVVPRTPDADLVAAVRAVVPDGVAGLLDSGNAGRAVTGAVRDCGALVTVSPLGAVPAERGLTMSGVDVRPDAAALAGLVDELAAGRLRTRVHEVLPLAEAAEAHRRGQQGGFRGKLVLAL